MKYVFKNIKGLIKNDFYMFLLIIVTVAGSCFMIHFAYAMYQNFMMEKQSDLKGINTLILEPDYELETTNGFVDINSIYLPKDDDDNEETIEVISRQAVMDTLTQTYFKYESERLDAIQNLPIYTIPKSREEE